MSDIFTMISKGAGSFTMMNRCESFRMSSKNNSFSFLGSNRGATGGDGAGVEQLEPRIESLEIGLGELDYNFKEEINNGLSF